MTVVTFFILVSINTIFTLLRKKSKIVAVVNIAVLALIYCGNIRGYMSDLYIYRLNYYGMESRFHEKGYVFLTDFFYKIGIPFNGFLLFVFILFIGAVLSFLSDYKCNYAVFFFLYCSFYYFFSLEVLRFFIALSFLIIGAKFLVQKRIKWYLFFVAIAASVHTSFVVFFVLAIIPVKSIKKKFYIHYMLVFVAMTIITIVNGKRIPGLAIVFKVISYFLGGRDIAFYDGTVVAEHSWMYSSLYYLFNWIFLIISKDMIQRGKKHIEKVETLYSFCFKSNSLMSIMLPFSVMSPTYFRMILVVTIFLFMLMAVIIETYYGSIGTGMVVSMKSNKSIHNGMLVMVSVIILWTMVWWYVNPNDTTIILALKQNIFY